eukprot:SAG25_NODE_5695_length_630_cov_0.677966_1_plen_48_part_10
MFSQVPLLLPEVEGRSEEQELVEAEGLAVAKGRVSRAGWKAGLAASHA